MHKLYFRQFIPNKLSNIVILYLDTTTYSLYLAITNTFIWLSHGNKFFINIIFNEEFSNSLMAFLFRRKNNRVMNIENHSNMSFDEHRISPNNVKPTTNISN